MRGTLGVMEIASLAVPVILWVAVSVSVAFVRLGRRIGEQTG